MSDYGFLKTGLGIATEDSESDRLTNERVKAVVILFARNATETAQKFVTHQGRKEITPQNLISSLKLQVFDFLRTENLLTKVQDIEVQMRTTQEPVDLAYVENKRKKTTSETPCTCQFCTRFVLADDLWGEWKPTTPFETILRNNIDRLL